MNPCRVHITGASGSGTTSLGRALAEHWGVPCHDTDDYFWVPSTPPFMTRRAVAERLDLMARLFLPREAWVLSGSLIGWGDPLIPSFDRVVFLRTNPEVRLQRLREREARRYGVEAIAIGGERHAMFVAFMDYAAAYDDPAFDGRSLHRHEAWLGRLPFPVLRLDSAAPTEVLVEEINDAN